MKKKQAVYQNIYLYTVSILGLIVLGVCIWRCVLDIQSSGLYPTAVWEASVLILLSILCRLLPIRLAADKSMDISFIPVVACAMTMGADAAVIFFAISTLFIFEREPDGKRLRYTLAKAPLKELCNTGNILISIFIGGLWLDLLGGSGKSLSIPYSLLPSSLFAVTTIFCNLLIFLLYFYLSGHGSYWSLLVSTVGGILPNIVSTIPFGLLLALILHMANGYFFILLFMLPLLLARYSFQLYIESKQVYMRTISSLSKAIEAKDRYTEGHSQRVSYYAEAIARAMHLRDSAIEEIRIAALLHDIGKIGIDDNVLNKPSSLSPEEFDEIKRHPVIGRKIIDEIHLSNTINAAVLYHHCNYDATGYPSDGPGPGKLPLAACIIAVADAFDAMTSDRPYRSGMSAEKAMSILKENSGTQFCPEVVDVMEKILPSLHPETLHV